MDIKITFGIIVLNGEPFTRYNLQSLYPFAHQIIVVEGACTSAAAVASRDGHSTDGTREVLQNIKKENDPEGKISIVYAEDEGHPNGFWPGEKHEMSQAYAKRATGNWLWQVDIDEFYRPEDINHVVKMLRDHKNITQVSFRMKTFSGSPRYLVDSLYLRCVMNEIRRLFAWGPSYQYSDHRPPTIKNELGQDLSLIHPISAKEMVKEGIYLYHYEQLFPKQVYEKISYYSKVNWTTEFARIGNWVNDCYMNLNHPFQVHMVFGYPSWFELNHLPNPPAVIDMVEAVKRSEHPGVELRKSEDIEALLRSRTYALARGWLKIVSPLYSGYLFCRKKLGRLRRWMLKVSI